MSTISLPLVFAQLDQNDRPLPPHQGLTLNLSRGGCLLESQYPADENSTLILSFEIPNQSRVEGLKAEVKTCQHLENKYYLGLCFIDRESPDYRPVDLFLSEIEDLRVRVL